jgi:hypothetical protein
MDQPDACRRVAGLMPAERFTKKATSKTDKRQWAHVYASSKKRGDEAGAAVRKANAVIAAKKVRGRQTAATKGRQ